MTRSFALVSCLECVINCHSHLDKPATAFTSMFLMVQSMKFSLIYLDVLVKMAIFLQNLTKRKCCLEESCLIELQNVNFSSNQRGITYQSESENLFNFLSVSSMINRWRNYFVCLPQLQ